jgi:hypothetical protein
LVPAYPSMPGSVRCKKCRNDAPFRLIRSRRTVNRAFRRNRQGGAPDLLCWHPKVTHSAQSKGVRASSVALPNFVASHAQAFDDGSIERFRRRLFAIVGASGTGSPTTEQLMRLGAALKGGIVTGHAVGVAATSGRRRKGSKRNLTERLGSRRCRCVRPFLRDEGDHASHPILSIHCFSIGTGKPSP